MAMMLRTSWVRGTISSDYTAYWLGISLVLGIVVLAAALYAVHAVVLPIAITLSAHIR